MTMGRFGMAMVWIEFPTNQIRQRVREEGSPELGVGGRGKIFEENSPYFLDCNASILLFSIPHILSVILCQSYCSHSVSHEMPHLCQ